MNVTLGNLSTVGNYMKTNTTKNMALDVAQNYVDHRRDDFEKVLDSTSINGCSCCSDSAYDYESTFDVSI